MASDETVIWKIGIVGEVGVGKTSILLQLVDKTFRQDTPTTIGNDFREKKISFHGIVNSLTSDLKIVIVRKTGLFVCV